MKTIKLLTLLAVLLCATTVWAQNPTTVTTEAELRSAIQIDGANITLTADIDLDNHNGTLSIATNTTVTIDLGGHTLDRKLTQRGENGGQVITVREDATLNLSNGTLKGGWGGDSGGINNEGGTVNLTNVTITGCTGDDKGGGICNRSGGTLTMNGGSITANTSNDHTTPEGGGGIFNAEDAMATLTNVSITGNEAKVKGGGGICNYGTLTIDGCTIQDNIAKMNGGGIWNGNDATLSINGGNISGNTADEHGGGIYTHSSFSMQGAVNITDNKKNGINNNVYLTPGAIITVTGALAGSSIGIMMETATGTFTSGYNTNNPGVDPSTLFTADLPEVMDVSLDANNEAQLESILPEGSVYYIERSWDEVSKKIVTQTIILNEGEYTLLTAKHYDDDLSLSGGTYVIKTTGSNEVFVDGFLKLNGDTKLILCDDAMLKIQKVIRVAPQKSLSVYGQMKDNGRLQNNGFLSHTEFDYCGIGTYDGRGATYSFHGGNINVRCEGGRAAGIGLGTHHSDEEGYVQMPNINIYGGTIKAVGEGGWEKDEYCSSPGIGSFWEGADGVITIYGGDVDATGGHGGAGIGVGNQGNGDDDSHIVINGGHVVAHGGERAAGIGGGQNKQGRKVIINGGHVEAYGGDNGSGIGSGSVCNYNGKAELTVNGGYVYAQGGSNGAGIGGGLESAGCKVLINGGEVHAFGGEDAAGIGGGWSNDGGNITITGGTVIAKGAGNGAGIGSGSEKINFGYVNGGSLTITGGHVEAYGGDDAAGIGGGEDADGGTVNISGGYVYAKGRYHGAGIGGGEKGDGGNVTITGGTVHASAGDGGTGNRAIGPGYDSNEYGSLTIGDLMMVWSERMAEATERVPMCWYRTDVHVEPCTHPNATYTVDGTDFGDHHTEHCLYCTTPFVPEEHQFEGDSCTVCHIHGSISTVSVYLPDIDEEGHYIDGKYETTPTVFNLVTNSTFYFPPAPQDPQGMGFAGWKDGDATGLTTFIAGESEVLHEMGSGFTISENVSFTSRFHKINLFNTAGNWNEANNWYWNEVPNGSDVVIAANAIVPNEYTAIVDSIAIDGGSLTIADGGQLITNSAVIATVQKTIEPYNPENTGLNNTDGWYFIASPVSTNYTPKLTMLSNIYDLYRLNNTLWENWKAEGTDHYHFNLENSHGYLYANSDDVTLEFTGAVLPSAASQEVSVNAGFNLIGNPFTYNVYANSVYYRMNGTRTGVEAVENYQTTPIAPCTGILINANAAETVTFTKEAPALSNNNGSLQIALTQANTRSKSMIDNAIVSFTEGNQLEKFHFGNGAKVYIPQSGKDYAIAFSESQGETPLNFKATENGEYTISVHPENVEMGYLHLIDNLTGADIDLLTPSDIAPPSGGAGGGHGAYTFSAKTTDYESRFKLVFSAIEDADSDDDAPFAFVSNGEIIVIADAGNATLQVIDVVGRVIRTVGLSQCGSRTSTIGMTPGVYVLRLINGDNIKTQKIIIN